MSEQPPTRRPGAQASTKPGVANKQASAAIEVFSTCPQSKGSDRATYVQHVIDVARWSEDAGCAGILVYTDNSLVDPWLISQVILQNTTSIGPLVAIQPIYMHPYAAAKMVASLGHLHGRRIYLNMLAGGFKNDLVALNDQTPHDERYDRTVEYTLIMKGLLNSAAPLTFEGKYYGVTNLKMSPPLPSELFPGVLISGSSEAGLEAARKIGATAIKYPKPSGEEEGPEADLRCGVRVGIIAREDNEEAWRIALERFPEDRKGQIAHGLAMKVSDSHWHKQLSELGANPVSQENPYWLGPFQNYRTFCPYLVGSYAQVAEELGAYIAAGYRTFVLDIPPSREELEHTGTVFEMASAQAQPGAD